MIKLEKNIDQGGPDALMISALLFCDIALHCRVDAIFPMRMAQYVYPDDLLLLFTDMVPGLGVRQMKQCYGQQEVVYSRMDLTNQFCDRVSYGIARYDIFLLSRQ